ncbi:MAG: copper-binding protein [Burkholderiales bacterium]|jgi:Cu/Ag efflux protein CusF|nr:copper-binding protein [Burkholderiales bacterium]
MKKLLFATVLTLAAAAPALAQHAGHGSAKPAASAAGELADGEVRRVDKARGAVLLKHGEIKSVNMGAMTMSFKLKDPAMAEQLKEGDKVKFAVEQKGDDLVITSIRKAP